MQCLAGSFFNRHAVTFRGSPLFPPRLLVGIGFQVCFTPLPGCFSPFPLGTVRYRSLAVFSLGPWSALFQTGFLVPRPTRDLLRRGSAFGYRVFTFFDALFQHASPGLAFSYSAGLQRSSLRVPLLRVRNGRCLGTHTVWAGPFSLTTTQGISSISFPPATEMFHFTGFPALRACTGCPVRVAPFRCPRITACLRLPAAFRRLLRLSSAASAKASVRYLSYLGPVLFCHVRFPCGLRVPLRFAVRCPLSVRCCILKNMVEVTGIEPTTSCVQSRRSPS